MNKIKKFLLAFAMIGMFTINLHSMDARMDVSNTPVKLVDSIDGIEELPYEH